MANEEKSAGLFPAMPEDPSKLTIEELDALIAEHEEAARLIDANDAEFLADVSDENEIISQYAAGAESFKILKAEKAARDKAYENYVGKVQDISSAFHAEDEPAPDDDSGDGDEEDGAVADEAEQITAEAAEEEEKVEERELVTASVEVETESTPEPPAPIVRFSRTAPAPSPERVPVNPVPRQTTGTALVASGSFKMNHEGELDQKSLAAVMTEAIVEHGAAEHNGQKTILESGEIKEIYADGRIVQTKPTRVEIDGPMVKTAKADFGFPEERTLTGNAEEDAEKIRAMLPIYATYDGLPGQLGGEALVASGGLCAPLEPIYTMPNFASEAEPVWDSLAVFRARRGGVNVPAATYIGDITTAISSISEADDQLGGTFATKSCQDLTCPTYTETAVQILAHCREYGNLNARAWPEKIAHENALTMAALSRTSERFMLDRIKALSIKTTSSLSGLSALTAIVDVIEREIASIRYLLRMDRNARFRAILPAWIVDELFLDTANTQYDRYRSKGQIVDYLRDAGVEPTFHLDNVTGAVPFTAETTGTALECFPTSVQVAIYAEGALLGIDSGVLELGIVRDSTLNSTNDFQVFGERFRNVAKLGPDQAVRWHTLTLSPNGVFPALGTAYSCTGGI